MPYTVFRVNQISFARSSGLLLALLLAAAGSQAAPAPIPLTRAHAHNDYEHPRPLLDALACGFCSVEADVYLVDGQLLVAHDRRKTSPERTLQALYLNPLQERSRQNGGRIYPGGPPCLLFIDLKTEAESTFAVLHRLLGNYPELITRFENANVTTNAVTVVITGNRPRATLAAQFPRLAACDGLMTDLESNTPPLLVPVISEQWSKFFKWRGTGSMPAAELARLKEVVAKAHQQGRRIRFWGAPDQPNAWRAFYEAGADLLNTDKLTGLRDFLLAQTGGAAPTPASPAAGWQKHPANPVLGGRLGTCFDVAVLREGGRYRMWFSWRPKKSLALVESSDGINWSEPAIVLGPNPDTKWEDDINRPVVVRRGDVYHLWYTGQAHGHSCIGYATSTNGMLWTRQNREPVLSPDASWEKVAVMCPHVEWDEAREEFRMWYSGGEQYEPDAIGYATSPNGLRWTKRADNPVFRGDPQQPWEQHKVTACQVTRQGDWFYMFYIGFRDQDHAQIGLARSRDGIINWERHPANPIICPTPNGWDHDACYKPFACFDGGRWLLWYNGRHGTVEQIGMAIHEGDVQWPAATPSRSP